MRLLSFIFLFSILSCSTQAQGLKGALQKVKEAAAPAIPLSEADIAEGLKQALDKGLAEAVTTLARENGYLESPYKILLPEEAQQVVAKLRAIPGFGDAEQKLIEKLNRAAEDAASEAGPIFATAIKNMRFTDAMNILMGNQDAATRYLESSTYQSLYESFRPVVISSLDEVNAREYWQEIVTAYNKIPLVKKVNPELDDYVTQRALAGLFQRVEAEELSIRTNQSARTSDLMKRVFARQDK